MGDISRNFSRYEFKCKCGCGFDAVDVELVLVLEELRKELGLPVVITSGNRCKRHNESVGGSKNSMHTKGMAVDIRTDIEPATIANYFERIYPNKYGIGRYKSWTHIDVREDKSRWNG